MNTFERFGVFEVFLFRRTRLTHVKRTHDDRVVVNLRVLITSKTRQVVKLSAVFYRTLGRLLDDVTVLLLVRFANETLLHTCGKYLLS